MVVGLALEGVPVSTGSVHFEGLSQELVCLLSFSVASAHLFILVLSRSFESSPLSWCLICRVRHLKPIFVIYFLLFILLSCELETGAYTAPFCIIMNVDIMNKSCTVY